MDVKFQLTPFPMAEVWAEKCLYRTRLARIVHYCIEAASSLLSLWVKLEVEAPTYLTWIVYFTIRPV